MARRLAATITGLALGLSTLPLTSVPAHAALQSGVAFTAASLPTWQTDGIVWATASAGGMVFVGGDFAALRPPGAAPGDARSVARANLAVLDGSTGAPLDCGPAVTGSTNPSVRALTVSPDGETLYIGGSFTTVGGVSGRRHVAALDIASCTPVAGFDPQPSGPLRALAATDSSVYFGGLLSDVGGVARGRAAAVAAVGATGAGELLPWDPRFDDEVRALAVRPGGSEVVVGGAFDTANGVSSRALAVVDPVGGDNRFVYGSLIPPKTTVQDLAVDATGFYAAHEGTGFQEFDGRTAFDWSDHRQRWRDTCLGATQAVVVYDDVLYSGSHVHDCTTMDSFPDGFRYHLLAQSVSDPTLLPWFPQTNDGIGEALGPRDMVVSEGSSDVLWVVGEFTRVNGLPQQGLTRFGQSAAAQASPTSPTPSVTSVRAGEVRVAWRESFDADDATLTYRVYRDGSLLHTETAQSWFWEREQRTFVDSGLVPGTSPRYSISVTDGNSTVTTSARSVTVAAADSAYASRVLSDGATGYWRYDEPSDVFFSDTSATPEAGYSLALTGGAAGYRVTPGALAGDTSPAMSVSGARATLYGERRLPPPGAFSVETWFKTETTEGGKLIGFGDKQVLRSRNFDRHVYMTDDGRLVFGVDDGARRVLTTADSYNDGDWHHVVATQGSSGMRLYVDGVQVGANGVTTAMRVPGYWRIAGDNISCRVTTCAGRVWPDAPTSDYFGGQLDETAVYAKALTAETVAVHHALGVDGPQETPTPTPTPTPSPTAPVVTPTPTAPVVAPPPAPPVVAPPPPPAGEAPAPTDPFAEPDELRTTRLAGADRYATAAAIVRTSFPSGPVPVVVIATGEGFADALAGGPAADALGGPVLPVASNAVPAAVRGELTRLQPARIVVLGGPGAISDAVVAELETHTTGTVTRLAGANRYATAAQVATTAFTAPVRQVLVATGSGFADALAGGAVGAKTGSPVLLVSDRGVPAETAAALRTLRPQDIAVLGGTAAVSDEVLQQLREYAVGGTVTRVAGGDRYATAARLAQVYWPETSRAVYLATGADFPDALSGVPAAGRAGAPLLLVDSDCMPAATRREIDRLQPTSIVVLGGPATVSSAAAAGTPCGAAP